MSRRGTSTLFTGASAALVAVTLAACASAATSSSTPAAKPAAGVTGPGGSSPPAAPPGGSNQTETGTSAYTLATGTASSSHRRYAASRNDESAVTVSHGASLALVAPAILTSGDSLSSDDSSFYGLNAAVLAESKGTVRLTRGTIATSGSGANDLFAYGSGSAITIAGATLTARGQFAHGVDASYGGSVRLTNVRIATAGGSGADLATDRGGGTVTATGGTFTTSGAGSPGIYSTGAISARDATFEATGSQAVVVEGANSVTLTNATLKGACTGTCMLTGAKDGVMLYQSNSGDAGVGTATFTMTGGSLTASTGDAFFIKNTNAAIVLRGGARINQASGNLLDVTGSSKATLAADGETLTGNVVTDATSTAATTLSGGSTLTGTIDKSALTLDSSSTWKVTGNSVLTSFSDAGGISGVSITNLVGNGHTVTYDPSLAANSALGGKTYSLAAGGELAPV